MSDPRESEREQDREAYEPPMAEDIETTHAPAEAAAGPAPVSPGRGLGVEESDTWH